MKAFAALAFLSILAFACGVPDGTVEPTQTPAPTPAASSAAPPATSATSPPPKCPPGGPNATLLPNPSDCTTYYACNSGLPVLMHCPEGLHFNNREKACDWPNRACCDPAHDPEKKCDKKRF